MRRRPGLMGNILTPVAILVLVAGMAGCDRVSPPAQAGVTAQDSAGVRIVSYTMADLDSAATQVMADSTPLVRIGAIDGPPGTTLNGVRAVTESASGILAVADDEGTVVRFYGPDGTYLGAQGAEGDGPGEYQSIMGLSYVAGDTLAVFDQGSARLSLISPARQFVRSTPLPIPPNRLGFGNRIYGLGPSAAVMLFQARLDPRRLRDPNRNMETRIEQDTLALLLLRLTDSEVVLDTLGRVAGTTLKVVPRPGGEGRTSIRFGSNPFLASGPSGFIVAHGSRFEIRHSNRDGELDQIIRVDATPKPVTSEDRAASGPEDERTAFADVHPLLSNIALDGNGNIWVAPHESIANGRGWLVFSAEGEIRGWVPHLNPHGWPLYVGTEHVYASTTDVVDALYISKYRIQTP